MSIKLFKAWHDAPPPDQERGQLKTEKKYRKEKRLTVIKAVELNGGE